MGPPRFAPRAQICAELETRRPGPPDPVKRRRPQRLASGAAPFVESWEVLFFIMAVGHNQWYHFGVGAPYGFTGF